jgi:hypothetical protein
MGGTSTTSQSQSSQLAPYGPASGALNGILGSLSSIAGNTGTAPNATQTGAINQIEQNANGQPNYNPAINSGTMGLLNGGGATQYDPAITANLDALKNGILGQTASGANIGKNPALQSQLDTIASDVTNQVNGSWAAAGRDGSPGNAQALARGIAQGEAPVIAAQYNTDTTNALNAANTLYGAGNTTYGILNGDQAAANQNFQNGVGTVGAGLNAENAGANSTLAAEAQRSGIPLSQFQTLLGMISPVAAAFGQQSGQSQGSSTMSGWQQLALAGQGLSGLGSFLFGA